MGKKLQGPFIYDVHKGGATKCLAILQMVADGFWGEMVFSEFVDVHTYKQEIYFFHHILSFLTAVWLLLHCFHLETSFAVNL